MKTRSVYLLVTLIGIILIISTAKDTLYLLQAGDKVTKSQQEVKKLEAENKILRLEYQKTQEPDFVENIAREKLNLVKPGEAIAIIPPELLPVLSDFSTPNLPNWKKWLNLFF